MVRLNWLERFAGDLHALLEQKRHEQDMVALFREFSFLTDVTFRVDKPPASWVTADYLTERPGGMEHFKREYVRAYDAKLAELILHGKPGPKPMQCPVHLVAMAEGSCPRAGCAFNYRIEEA